MPGHTALARLSGGPARGNWRWSAFAGHATVVVNLTGTQFCDMAGVHVLVSAHQQAVAKGGELLLVVPASAAVRRVFELTGIDFLIPTSRT